MTPKARARTVAVIGDARLEAGDPREALAERMGKAIVEQGWILVTGGLGGVMEAASRGGRSAADWRAGAVVGILPGHDPSTANRYVDVAMPTGMDLARNTVVAHADAVVAIGGGAGTLSEMAIAWQLGRLLLGFTVEGWSGELAGRALDGRHPGECVVAVDTVQEAVRVLRERGRVGRGHRGIPAGGG